MKRDVPHFRIGLLLTEAGILAPKQLDDAIRQGEEEGLPFLKVLVSGGTLKQHELQAVIRAQSLIWGGLLDVEKAISALNMVHINNVSFDDGLRSIGWTRPESMSSETIVSAVRTAPSGELANLSRAVPRACQYCATPLANGNTFCAFCTGDNTRTSLTTKAVPDSSHRLTAISNEQVRVKPANPPRSPILMALFSGICWSGFGQIIVGQTAKGAILAVLAIVLAFITGGVSNLILLPLSALDAYLIADKLKNGNSVLPWEFF